MRAFAWTLLFATTGLCAPVQAQVISGESTYEDNFVHTPPSGAERPASHDPSKSADPASSYMPSRGGRERERD